MGGFMMKYKLEYSLALGLAVMLLCCAFPPRTMQWWSVAFSPLCDEILSSGGSGEIVLRSKLWEVLSSFPR